jgi:uncharacterized protein
MQVNVKRIPSQGEVLRGTDPAKIIDIDDSDVRFEHEIEYDLLAQIQGNALLVTGKLDTVATRSCGRCLRRFEQPLHVEEFVFHEELTGEDFVDLTPQIREDIILELSQRALCQDDCKGLCPRCGIDRNRQTCQCAVEPEDARWHGLDNLKLR